MKTLSVPDRHRHRIALDTLRLHKAGASIMGGLNHRQAVEALREYGHSDADIRTRLETAGHSAQDIAEFMA